MAITNSAKKIKNNTFAIEAAPSAMPPNPKIAAMMAMTKKIIDQRNIVFIRFVIGESQLLLKLFDTFNIKDCIQIFVPPEDNRSKINCSPVV